MRVVAVTRNLSRSGSGIALLRLLRALRSRHPVELIPPEGGGELSPDFAAADIPLQERAVLRPGDLVLVNSIIGADVLLDLTPGIHSLLWVHEPLGGLDYIRDGVVSPEALKRAGRVVFPTRWQAERVYAPLLGDNWSVVPMGLPLPETVPEPPADGPVRVFFSGMLVPRKGIDLLLEAVRRVPGTELVVAGTDAVAPDFAAALRHTAAEPGLAGRVIFTGPLDEAGIWRELARSHLFAFPSRDDLVTLSVLEAMALARCVLVTDYGPVRESLIHGENVLMSPVNDVEAFAANLALAASDAALRRRLGEAARSVVAGGRHDFTRFVDAMDAELHRAAGR
ncbi:MAG: glycosyltransferase family 4 protein [Caulobacter sp.]|nr:glycosyltransferase family 4 protein [Caulobacter sp.]